MHRGLFCAKLSAIWPAAIARRVEMKVVKVISVGFWPQYRAKGPTRTFVNAPHHLATGSSIPPLEDADLLARF